MAGRVEITALIFWCGLFLCCHRDLFAGFGVEGRTDGSYSHSSAMTEEEASWDVDDGGLHAAGQGDPSGGRRKKLLNLFSVVRFRNVPCIGSNNLNGTCYSSVECGERGGTSSGSCAAGYGVCCTFTIGCGATSSENCTYFQSSGSESGQCCATICPCNDNICQIRLDFSTFVITGPSTISTQVGTALNGILTPGAGVAVSTRTQCLTDTFSVTTPGNNAPPTICGTNTGEHMYLDASDACNMLCFQLGNTANGVNSLETRSWNIKATQFSCDFDNLAPDGCTQYFFGSLTDVVQTFNFNSGRGEHLADQDQSVCVRRERSYCRICWTPMQTDDFAVSAPVGQTGGVNTAASCCGYGANGDAAGMNGFDCVILPGASRVTKRSMIAGDEFCGRSGFKTTTTGGAMNLNTVCSMSTPFRLRFLSDLYEITGAETESTGADAGVRLAYIQMSC